MVYLPFSKQAANHAHPNTDIQQGTEQGPGGYRDLIGDSIEPLPAAREIVTALGICIGFFCDEDQKVAPGAKVALSHSGERSEGSPWIQTGGIDHEPMRQLFYRDVQGDAGGYLDATSHATAVHEEQDAHLRLQLESAITMLGLSSEEPHALPTAVTDGSLGKGPVQGGEKIAHPHCVLRRIDRRI